MFSVLLIVLDCQQLSDGNSSLRQQNKFSASLDVAAMAVQTHQGSLEPGTWFTGVC